MVPQKLETHTQATASSVVSDSPAHVGRSLSELEQIRPLWDKLLIADQSPFQTFSWNLKWYLHYQDYFDEMLVFVFGNQSAIFPMYRKGRELRLAGDETCDYQDAIAGGIQDVEDALQSLINWAEQNKYEINFQKLATTGYLYEAIQNIKDQTSYFSPLESSVGPCPYFGVSDEPESQLAHLPRKFRAELRRQMRRIQKDFEKTTLNYHKSEQIGADDIQNMVEFHNDNFRFSGKNPLQDIRLQRLLRDVSEDPAVGLCIARLGNEDNTLAMDITFIRGGKLYGFLTAYNQDCARYSPGRCLLTSRLDKLASDEQVRIVDFLCGSESYKYRFAQGEYHVKSIRMIPRTLKGTCKQSSLHLEAVARSVAKLSLDKLGIRKNVQNSTLLHAEL